jgi:hypothetical protein
VHPRSQQPTDVVVSRVPLTILLMFTLLAMMLIILLMVLPIMSAMLLRDVRCCP